MSHLDMVCTNDECTETGSTESNPRHRGLIPSLTTRLSPMSTALIFGANGISGIALLHLLSATSSTEWRTIIALSRRPPLLDYSDPRIAFRSVDLLDSVSTTAEAIREAGGDQVTHVFFYAYIEKKDEGELIDVNVKLLRNVCPGVG